MIKQYLLTERDLSVYNENEVEDTDKEKALYSHCSLLKRPLLKLLVRVTKFFVRNRESLRLRRTYIYSIVRKIFLKMVIEKLNLKDIEVINDRAENIINNHREKYDYATARAVAALNILLELLVPFVKVNGSVIALKGSSYNEEINLSKNAFKELNVELSKIYHESLPNDLGDRPILLLTKTKPTNKKYPRAYAQIKKKPL